MFNAPTWSRRGLGIAAIGLLGVAGLGVYGLRLSPPAPGMVALSAEDVALVEALSAALFPAGALPVRGGDGRTAPLVDTLLADQLDPSAADPFRYVLQALDEYAMVTAGSAFADLPVSEARSIFSAWADPGLPPRRLAAESIKAVLGLAFFRRPDVIAAIGWKRGCGA